MGKSIAPFIVVDLVKRGRVGNLLGILVVVATVAEFIILFGNVNSPGGIANVKWLMLGIFALIVALLAYGIAMGSHYDTVKLTTKQLYEFRKIQQAESCAKYGLQLFDVCMAQNFVLTKHQFDNAQELLRLAEIEVAIPIKLNLS